jgi:hypothetical protein
MNATLISLNILVALSGFILAALQRRLGIINWALILYFMLWFTPLATADNIKHIQNFSNGMIRVDQTSIFATQIFILLFNTLFLFCDQLFFRLHKRTPEGLADYTWPKKYDLALVAFFAMLAYGSIGYYLNTRDFTYTDYVENVASWPMVFLLTASSGICLAAFRRNYLLCAIMIVPFIYFMVHLKVRSFALLSIIPALIILAMQLNNKRAIFTNVKLYVVFIPIFIALLFFANYAMDTKQKKARETSLFPDAGMPIGCTIIMQGIRQEDIATHFDSLKLYGANLSNPFRRIFGIQAPDLVDPPVVMARIYEGFSKHEKSRYHYPVLWYTDAFLAFGLLGVLFAVFWAFMLNVFERLTTHNTITMCIFLPAYCWHSYMLIRGAISGSAVPFLYAVWIAILVFLVLGIKELLQLGRPASSLNTPISTSGVKPLFRVG